MLLEFSSISIILLYLQTAIKAEVTLILILLELHLFGCQLTLNNDIIIQIYDFLMFLDKQRKIKSNEVQLLNRGKKKGNTKC